jgi:hypothetical protein
MIRLALPLALTLVLSSSSLAQQPAGTDLGTPFGDRTR